MDDDKDAVHTDIALARTDADICPLFLLSLLNFEKAAEDDKAVLPVGLEVGRLEGFREGTPVGCAVGVVLGRLDGCVDGFLVGWPDG